MSEDHNGTGSLIPTRLSQYQECHQHIAEAMASGLETFVKIGLELKRMRTLYDAGNYKTFEDYCQKEWEWSYARAGQMMRAAEIRVYLPDLPRPIGGQQHGVAVVEWTEGSIRPLTTLDTTADVKRIGARVVKEVEKAIAAGEKPRLGAIVKRLVEEVKERKKEKETPELPEMVKKWAAQVRRLAGMIERLSGEGDALELLARDKADIVENFAEAIGRLEKAWEVTRPAPGPRRKVVEAL